MGTVIAVHHEPEQYGGDVLFRVYQNQDENFDDKEFFAFEVMTRTGYPSSTLNGRYTSEHPQAVKAMMRKVIDEAIERNHILQISNEMESFGAYAHYHLWMKDAIKHLKSLTSDQIEWI